jgi:hypothetical protein
LLGVSFSSSGRPLHSFPDEEEIMSYLFDDSFDVPHDPMSPEPGSAEPHMEHPAVEHSVHGLADQPRFSGIERSLNSGIEPVTFVAIPNSQIEQADQVLNVNGIEHSTMAQVHGEFKPVSLAALKGK